MSRYTFDEPAAVIGEATLDEALDAIKAAKRRADPDPAKTTCGHWGCCDHEEPARYAVGFGGPPVAEAEMAVRAATTLHWTQASPVSVFRDLLAVAPDGSETRLPVQWLGYSRLVAFKVYDAPTGGNLLAEVNEEGRMTQHAEGVPFRTYVEPA